ncbi:hypothetical protein SNE40_009646 [Patella caerulea]|uniref:Uncharacterized protein n=1 Tax=Patella caerulea TaxID=87958 RepID=A0AAN8JZG1_PATCE
MLKLSQQKRKLAAEKVCEVNSKRCNTRRSNRSLRHSESPATNCQQSFSTKQSIQDNDGQKSDSNVTYHLYPIVKIVEPFGKNTIVINSESKEVCDISSKTPFVSTELKPSPTIMDSTKVELPLPTPGIWDTMSGFPEMIHDDWLNRDGDSYDNDIDAEWLPMEDDEDDITKLIKITEKYSKEDTKIINQDIEIPNQGTQILDMKILNQETEILNHDTDILNHGTGILNHDTDILNHDTDILNQDTDILIQNTDILNHDTDILNHDTDILNYDTDVLNEDTDILNEDTDISNHDTDIILNQDTDILNQDTDLPHHATEILTDDTEILNQDTGILNDDTDILNHDTAILNHDTDMLNHEKQRRVGRPSSSCERRNNQTKRMRGENYKGLVFAKGEKSKTIDRSERKVHPVCGCLNNRSKACRQISEEDRKVIFEQF